MLAVLAFAAALATAAPGASADAAKPTPVAAKVAKAKKTDQVCVTKKAGRLFGHDVTHVKCEDAKPAPAAAPSPPS